MLHVAVAAPNLAENVDHDIIGPLYYERPASCTPVQFENGCAIVPDGPGLGIEFDPALA
jgi:muconate cycloisomerase